MPRRIEWVTDLKPGDRVLVGVGYGKFRVDYVERLTKTQIVLKNSVNKFRRKDGHRVGDTGWARAYLAEPTPDKVNAIRRENLRERLAFILNHGQTHQLSLYALRRMHAIATNDLEKSDELQGSE